MCISYFINHIYGLILKLLFYVDVDECNSLPCENNGTCINSLGSYTCNCSKGWQNEDCKEGLQRLITVADQLIRNNQHVIFAFTQNIAYIPFSYVSTQISMNVVHTLHVLTMVRASTRMDHTTAIVPLVGKETIVKKVHVTHL